jgi:hypothetical protein
LVAVCTPYPAAANIEVAPAAHPVTYFPELMTPLSLEGLSLVQKLSHSAKELLKIDLSTENRT